VKEQRLSRRLTRSQWLMRLDFTAKTPSRMKLEV